LRTLCKSIYKHHGYYGEDDKRQLVAATEVLLSIGQGKGTLSHLFLSMALLGPDKSARILAAEVIIKGVCESSINLPLLGKMLGEMVAASYFPMKRLTDILSTQLFNISAQHNEALLTLIEAIIKELPDQPVRGTKQLLGIYKELSAMLPIVMNTEVQQRLQAWQSSPSLKKLSGQVMALQQVA